MVRKYIFVKGSSTKGMVICEYCVVAMNEYRRQWNKGNCFEEPVYPEIEPIDYDRPCGFCGEGGDKNE